MPDLSRRRLLTGSVAIGCSAAASPLLTPVTLASAPGENRLVVIVLRGAMDGLDVVQPLGDAALTGLRPGFDIGEAGGAQDLDGYFALHGEAADLMPLWRAGELSFAHAVSTPYRDKRSHFDGQDLLENGGGDATGTLTEGRDGWLNRMLTLVPGTRSDTAIAVGRSQPLILSGSAPAGSWSPETDLDLSAQAELLLADLYASDPLFASAAETAIALSAGRDVPGGMSPAKAGQAVPLASFAAERLNEEARIAAFSIGGWDSHRRQKTVIRRPLRELTAALLTLKSELGRNWERTTVLAMTEFGRTARENGVAGTDHGTGGAMVMAGGALRGRRVHGDWPGLGEGDLYEDRDLRPTGDIRRYAAWTVRGLFGLERSEIERVVFPGVDLGANPKILS
ncbi:MAG: DUF1501 domain-containing protein [Pseudomonadota bacterium]